MSLAVEKQPFSRSSDFFNDLPFCQFDVSFLDYIKTHVQYRDIFNLSILSKVDKFLFVLYMQRFQVICMAIQIYFHHYCNL